MSGAFQFKFELHVSLVDVELSLHLAMFAVEGLAGQVRVRMDARYHVDQEGHAIFVDGGSQVGLMISRVFAGLLLRELGEDAFCLHQVDVFPNHLQQERTVTA